MSLSAKFSPRHNRDVAHDNVVCDYANISWSVTMIIKDHLAKHTNYKGLLTKISEIKNDESKLMLSLFTLGKKGKAAAKNEEINKLIELINSYYDGYKMYASDNSYDKVDFFDALDRCISTSGGGKSTKSKKYRKSRKAKKSRNTKKRRKYKN